MSSRSSQTSPNPRRKCLPTRSRRTPRRGDALRLSAVDPLNLAGILTPGPRIPALPNRWIVFRDGIPEEEGGARVGAEAS